MMVIYQAGQELDQLMKVTVYKIYIYVIEKLAPILDEMCSNRLVPFHMNAYNE